METTNSTQKPHIVGPQDGKAVDLAVVGVRFMAWAEETGGGFSLVEHPIPPGMLAAPLHRHNREDEYSYVLEGRMGALLGDDVVYGEPGDFIFKPRNQWHTFWNAGENPCRILEIISPGGFEHYFDELAETMGRPDFNPGMIPEIAARYALDVDPEGTARVCGEHGLTFPMGPGH
jgi:mannose-6-phosphate isomerase-like protein (cupin superfamily)